MASLSFNSLILPPSRPRKLSQSSNDGLKPITVTGSPPTFVSAPGRRIVAVGDLHGDLTQTRCALKIAGVLSTDGQDLWIGGETVNGNHETMNVEGDFRYVDPGAFDECVDFLDYLEEYEDNWEDAFVQWISVAERWKKERKMSQSHWGPWNIVKRQKGVVARSSLFGPGGPLACELAQHGVVLKVDDWVFCHGGLLPHHVAYGIERMNREVAYWMQGFDEDNDTPEIPFIATRGYDSVVWNRLYSSGSADECQNWQISSIAEKTLQALGAKGMVVGHTPQANGVNCKHDDRIWCIDVGMSNGVLNSRPEVLEIVDNKARVLRNQNEFSQLEVADYL
ncbi:shewanella-like protein phosphatase 1 [Iris pallida]|uniref:Shewanella-like protein phosphatase 1 n=1 Tax=Iris pallida TaxID=29817 RepID=A0AAX6ER37_IRIPA|nr:shewanella-like protein phosphatase 1 [Iris pallida]